LLGLFRIRARSLQLWPGDQQAVVGAGFFCLLGFLAVVVEAVGQGTAVGGEVAMARNLLELSKQIACCSLTASFKAYAQLVGALTDAK
jgi:hypothetical protein